MTRRDDAIFALAVALTIVGAIISGVVAVTHRNWSMLVQCGATLVWMTSAIIWYNTAREQNATITEILAALRRAAGEE